jgi:site-specific DNA-adenine methylase
MKSKLSAFGDRLQENEYHFLCKDFRELDTSALAENSLVYCDPPYLITCATYNEQDGWNEQSERDLLAFLDGLNERGIKFALSNVLSSKGMTNEILAEWLRRNQYRVIHLDYKYSNSNYQRKDRSGVEDEVLIINYEEE